MRHCHRYNIDLRLENIEGNYPTDPKKFDFASAKNVCTAIERLVEASGETSLESMMALARSVLNRKTISGDASPITRELYRLGELCFHDSEQLELLLPLVFVAAGCMKEMMERPGDHDNCRG